MGEIVDKTWAFACRHFIAKARRLKRMREGVPAPYANIDTVEDMGVHFADLYFQNSLARLDERVKEAEARIMDAMSAPNFALPNYLPHPNCRCTIEEEE